MKQIETLVEDIYDILENGLPESVTDDAIRSFGLSLATTIGDRLRDRSPRTPELRMSNLGTPCNRKLWYEMNKSEDKESLRPEVRMKFLYGDILEELLIFLAGASGHSVTGRQDTLEIEGVKGHRDGVIDGVTVDTKSASTYSFQKFKEGGLKDNDPFGYIDQIQSYIHAGQDDPLVIDKTRGAFLVVDKTLGHLCLDIHEKSRVPQDAVVRYKKEVVSRPEPPARRYDPEPEGKSGNLKLGTVCSYCDFKKTCYPELRTFLYSNKPVYLTKVVREPKVPELRGEGTSEVSED